MQTTLAHEIWPASQSSRMAQALMVIAGTALLALSAKIQVPFWPVPMTMQTFVVLLLGITYGPRLGFATGFLYLLEGALGLPVFAKGGGIAYLMGPTGGYLIGFVAAMTLMGFLANRGWDRKAYSVVGAMMIGEMVIFLPGVLASDIGPCYHNIWSKQFLDKYRFFPCGYVFCLFIYEKDYCFNQVWVFYT